MEKNRKVLLYLELGDFENYNEGYRDFVSKRKHMMLQEDVSISV
jgi:hypothetical protein